MKIIAITEKNYLIEATKEEIISILTAVNGKKLEKLEINQKIPAIDYATTIRKIKTLETDYAFKEVCQYTQRLFDIVEGLKLKVKEASQIEE